MTQAETFAVQDDNRLPRPLEEIVRAAYDDYCNGDTWPALFAIRQAAREAYQLGRHVEREFGVKPPKERR